MRAIQVKYLPGTTHKGSRVKAWIGRERGESVSIPYEVETSFYNAACKLARQLGWVDRLMHMEGAMLPNGDWVFLL